MIESKVTCDRCKKPCGGTTYYTIDIYGHDIKQSPSVSTETAAQNMHTNLAKGLGTQRHYCDKCKAEIEDFMRFPKEVLFKPIEIPVENKPKFRDLLRRNEFLNAERRKVRTDNV
jgi:hypothetical protein